MLLAPVIHSHRALGTIVSILEFILRAMRTYCRFRLGEGVMKRMQAEMRPVDKRVPRVSATAWWLQLNASSRIGENGQMCDMFSR